MPPPAEDDFRRVLTRALELQRQASEAWTQVQRVIGTQPPTSRSRRRQTTPLVHLTPRESQVITLMVTGMPNRSIARQLRISERTVKSHLHSIFGKLGVATRGEAAACLRGDANPPAPQPTTSPLPMCPACPASHGRSGNRSR
ncbi:response regulator transcription factor [Actinosynnema sp. CS-041913]|uniref:response regulator transcription factor n=1 Tax=Actinosynnema sp. CS-041913 TaxID=3239917 RepID=UPI003D94B58E